jgi:hypothetical protein
MLPRRGGAKVKKHKITGGPFKNKNFFFKMPLRGAKVKKQKIFVFLIPCPRRGPLLPFGEVAFFVFIPCPRRGPLKNKIFFLKSLCFLLCFLLFLFFNPLPASLPSAAIVESPLGAKVKKTKFCSCYLFACKGSILCFLNLCSCLVFIIIFININKNKNKRQG